MSPLFLLLRMKWVIPLVFMFLMLGCAEEQLRATPTPIPTGPPLLIDDGEASVHDFVPPSVPGLNYDKVEVLHVEDQGFVQRGFIYYKIANSSEKKRIIVNMFSCNMSSVSCQSYLRDGVKRRNPTIRDTMIDILGRQVDFFDFAAKGSEVNVTSGTISTDATSYIWCEGAHCFQVMSFYEYDGLSRGLMSTLIQHYTG